MDILGHPDAQALLTDAEKQELKPILDAKPQTGPAVASRQRPFVQKWTVADLARGNRHPGGGVRRFGRAHP